MNFTLVGGNQFLSKTWIQRVYSNHKGLMIPMRYQLFVRKYHSLIANINQEPRISNQYQNGNNTLILSFQTIMWVLS